MFMIKNDELIIKKRYGGVRVRQRSNVGQARSINMS